MCVPCAPAVFELWPLLGGILLILGMLVVSLFSTLRKIVPPLAAAFAMLCVLTYRWVTGAHMRKPVRKAERDMPQRRVARHVHAVGRVTIPAALAVAVAYPYVAWFLASVTAGTAVAAVTQFARRHRALRAARQPAPAINEPIRVHAVIGRG